MSESMTVLVVIAAAVLAEVLLIVFMLSAAKRRDDRAKSIASALSDADRRYLVRTPARQTKDKGAYLPAICIDVKEKSRGAVVSFIMKDEFYKEYRNSGFRIVKVQMSKNTYNSHPIKCGDRTFVLMYGYTVKIGFDVK